MISAKKRAFLVAAAMATVGGSAWAAPLVDVQILLSTSAAGPYTANIANLPVGTNELFYQVVYTAITGQANNQSGVVGSTAPKPRTLTAIQPTATGVSAMAFDLFGNVADTADVNFLDVGALGSLFAGGASAHVGVLTPRVGEATTNDLLYVRPQRNGLTGTSFNDVVLFASGTVNVAGVAGQSATINARFSKPLASSSNTAGNVSLSFTDVLAPATVKSLLVSYNNETAAGADTVFKFNPASFTFAGGSTNFVYADVPVSHSGIAHIPAFDSTAQFLAGEGPTAPVLGPWRAPTPAEEAGIPKGDFNSPLPMIISDVVEVGGTTGQFVLQMSYDSDPALFLLGGESGAAHAGYIQLARLDGTSWVPAEGAKPGSAVNVRAYDPALDVAVGTWGVDLQNHRVWQVVDQSGTYAAVPEPATIGLLGLAAMGLTIRRRRHTA